MPAVSAVLLASVNSVNDNNAVMKNSLYEEIQRSDVREILVIM